MTDMVSVQSPRINVKAFIEGEFGDLQTLHDLICAKVDSGVPQYDSVYRWLRRGSLPADWLATLIVLRELETGAPVSMKNYVLGDRECQASPAKPYASGDLQGIFG